MKCNIERVINDLNIISEFSEDIKIGCTRFSFSHHDNKARDYLISEMRKLKMDVIIDGIGNIRGRYYGFDKSAPSIMIGSHIDTVPNGGKYDGVLGVVTALETIRVIDENKIQINNPIELIIFSEEEGSNFRTTLLGSKVLAGKVDIDYLKSLKNDGGISGYEVIKTAGYDVDNLSEYKLDGKSVKAMIELHIEQGAILDHKKCPVGIVSSIAGMRTYKVKLNGLSNHAGTTPMYLRNDPMVGASEIIMHMHKSALEPKPDTRVATVGKIHCYPNAANVIAGEVEFFVDIRDVKTEGIDILSNELFESYTKSKEKYNLNGSIELIGESEVVHLSEIIITQIEQTALENNIEYIKMNSGAVHDSVVLSEITNVGMIFVPSVDGISHSPVESTREDDIETGCNLLISSVIKLANN